MTFRVADINWPVVEWLEIWQALPDLKPTPTCPSIIEDAKVA